MASHGSPAAAAAPAPANPPSNLARALDGSAAAAPIPKPAGAVAADWAGRDSFAAVLARPAAAAAPAGASKGPPRAGLPTPPNSISPMLPPHGFGGRAPSAPPTPPAHPLDPDEDRSDHGPHADNHPRDSDPEHAGTGAHARAPADDAIGALTPALLATHHLAPALLAHGPLTLAALTAHLAAAVPGFARHPPARARRLVAAALEQPPPPNTSSSSPSTAREDIVFERLAGGRWAARRRGQPLRARGARHASPVIARSAPGAAAWRSPSPYERPGRSAARAIPHRPRPGAARRAALARSARDDEDEDDDADADRMSVAVSDASTSDGDDEEDGSSALTDEEDWASLGAAALRAGWGPENARPERRGKGYDYNARVRRDSSNHARRRAARSRGAARSAPGVATDVEGMRALMRGVGADEGEAARALLCLGGV